MATLNLTMLWINLASTGEAISAQTEPGRRRKYGINGSVMTFAGGRRRSVAKEGAAREFGFTVVRISLATLEQLESWAGQDVQIRDHRGQRFYGVYFDVDTSEYKDPFYAAAITLLGTTEV